MENINSRLVVLALLATVIIATAAISMTPNNVDAKITPVCRNGAGNENNGCNDNNQPPQDEQNENPAGHAPPGQN